MSKKRLLLVTQEIEPYTAFTEISNLVRQIPNYFQSKGGMEIRILMPKFGEINERRHRLHEVVRLSGMNIIVNDEDYPLIIKVASLPGARLQVYFLDNDDFFKRKRAFEDEEGNPYMDNEERTIFFCRGVFETVKKFGWSPDYVYCHGWMTSLIPAYLKTAYKDEPIFGNAKVVYNIYDSTIEHTFTEDFLEKAIIGNMEDDDLEAFRNTDGTIGLHQGAIHFADAVIQGSENLNANVSKLISKQDKPTCFHSGSDDFLVEHLAIFHTLTEEEQVEE